MKFKTILAFVILTICGCERENEVRSLDPSKDVLIFGTFAGFCTGERCVELFALQEGKLYEDRSDAYPQSSPLGHSNFEQLGADKYDLVQSLFTAIPDQLLRAESTSFGCPDCSDGGGVYIEIKRDQATKVFIIDNFRHNIPEYLHQLVDIVHEKVDLLQ